MELREEITQLHKILNQKDMVPERCYRRNNRHYPLVCYVNNISGLFISSNFDGIPIFIDRAYKELQRLRQNSDKNQEYLTYYGIVLKYLGIMADFCYNSGAIPQQLISRIPKMLFQWKTNAEDVPEKIDDKDHIITIDGVKDKEGFFSSFLTFYARFDVVLSVWGGLSEPILANIGDFIVTSSRLRKVIFGEINISLNNLSIDKVLASLCHESLLSKLTWGLHKGDISLALMRAWDDLYMESSPLIDACILIDFIEGLKSRQLIDSYEIITG